MTNPNVQTPTTQQNDEQAIRNLTEDWLAAVKAKDITRLINMVAEDCIFLPPGHPPIRGRQAVEAMYNTFFPQFSSVEQRATLDEIEVAGDWAFAWGAESFDLVPLAGSQPIHMEGKAMSILQRQSDGTWKFARGINNTTPRPAVNAK